MPSSSHWALHAPRAQLTSPTSSPWATMAADQSDRSGRSAVIARYCSTTTQKFASSSPPAWNAQRGQLGASKGARRCPDGHHQFHPAQEHYLPTPGRELEPGIRLGRQS